MAYIEPKSPKGVIATHSRFSALHAEEFDQAGEYHVQKSIRNPESDTESDISQLKTTKGGSIVLIPQPSEDPEDPLNWSFAKKASVFACIIPGCFLTDWGKRFCCF
jgi:hypothetical protein